ncbi:hypothetical protein Y032_0333g2810 [Ancylostoma ceylanicum]|uniref:Uncharacterized protein n=1 Tax=Ancylostoma ceylanicum TaxID=53326 RepID=A0A016RZ05_9BILA|nr:hypothetical protein Y032_0333g2810 [Ancylostoma ceylanicum]
MQNSKTAEETGDMYVDVLRQTTATLHRVVVALLFFFFSFFPLGAFKYQLVSEFTTMELILRVIHPPLQSTQ